MQRRARHGATAFLGVSLFAFSACVDDPLATPRQVTADITLSIASENELEAYMDALNAQLQASGAPYRAAMAEYTTVSDSGQAGGTVLAKSVGNKQLDSDFVPHDVRRPWSGPAGGATDDITYAIDQTGDAVPPFGGLTAAQTTAAIIAATNSWEDLNCSTLPLVANPDFGIDIGLVAFQNGLGGSPFVFADVQHAGWRDINFAGGILGVTFTFVFIDGSGNPTDIDGNGKADVALREIYYDPSFSWATNGTANIDVQSIAVHEIGHGLSQGHFGTVRLKNDGTLKASPRAVMNALYSAPFRELTGSDNGGHCSNWSNWPNN
jgi:hypothetical protein